MNTKMTKIVSGCCVFAGVVFLLSSYMVDRHEEDIVNRLTLEIVEQEKTLLSIASITSRDGMDVVGESIIVDCKGTDRSRFDGLLSRLGELTFAELTETENLFDKCASFYAQRKAMMVARLVREYEAYSNLIGLLEIVDDEITVASYNLQEWEHLLSLEKVREELYYEQVSIQENIIVSLKEGKTLYDEEITSLVQSAKNVADELIVNDKQAREVRSKLADI